MLGGAKILCSFRLVPERKTGKKIPESSRLGVLEKFSANNFALTEAKNNTSQVLNRTGIADLPLLRTLLAIHHKSWESSFWEVLDSCFISICKFGSFNNPFATTTSLFELYFRFSRFIVGINEKGDFYELRKQHKLMKTIEKSEVWPDTYAEGCIHQF